jgi:threonine dehydratase
MVNLAEIEEAAALISGHILRTPLVYSPTFSSMTGADVYLKLENLQRGGSFKVRGATYKILSRIKGSQGVGLSGVVAASVGNHAQGVALAAASAGVSATIVMPVWASLPKQEATKGYGAEVILQGQNLAESIGIAQDLALSTGRTFIHPYDDCEIMTGQGTIGLEIMEGLPYPDLVLVPVGGGGLIGGIASAVKALRPKTRVIGVQAAACPSAREALRRGGPVAVRAASTIADAISVTEIGESNYPLLRDLVEDVVLVNESEIAAAVLLLLERKKVLAEGAGAVPLAALLSGAVDVPTGSKVVLVISGGNLDSLLLDRVIRQGLATHGRVVRFSVCLEDVPGSLALLLARISEKRANVVSIRHFRHERDLPMNYTRVDLELETLGFDHIHEIDNSLRGAGYEIKER